MGVERLNLRFESFGLDEKRPPVELEAHGPVPQVQGSRPVNRLREFREAAGLTQQQLADKVGAHWITISKLERGKMKLTTEWMERLARHLKIEPTALYQSEADTRLTAIEAKLDAIMAHLGIGGKNG